MNLAALEVVDYVVIDPNSKPLENLRDHPARLLRQRLRIHAGRHSSQDARRERRSSKATAVSCCSRLAISSILPPPSSRTARPTWPITNSVSLMDAEGIYLRPFARSAWRRSRAPRSMCVGDTIVDSYTYCTLIGGNTKTPTFSVKFDRQVDFVGGAGIVAKHMKTAKADVTFTTVLGNDAMKDFVLRDLEA